MREPQTVLAMVQRVKVLSREAVLAEVADSLEALVRRYISLDGFTERDDEELEEILRSNLETLDLIISQHSRGEIGSLEQRDRIRQSNRHCRELIEEKFPPFIRDTFPTPKEPTR